MSDPKPKKARAKAALPATNDPQPTAPGGGAANASPRGSQRPSRAIGQPREKTGAVTQSVKLLVEVVGRPLAVREVGRSELAKELVVKSVATAFSLSGHHFGVGELVAGTPAQLGGIPHLK